MEIKVLNTKIHNVQGTNVLVTEGKLILVKAPYLPEIGIKCTCAAETSFYNRNCKNYIKFQ